MHFDPHDLEIAAFFLLVLLFELWERWRPARTLNRLSSLRIDVCSFALAVLMNRACTRMVEDAVQATAPAFALESLHWVRDLSGWIKIPLAIVVVDFILYWLHRAQHQWPVMWRTHAWHHSTEQLYWFSGFRTSFLHSFLYNIPQAAVPMLIFELTPLQAGVAYSLGMLVQFWEHTNVDVEIGWLQKIVITPRYHRIHHSAVEPRNRNFAPVFSFWDLCFGTYTDPRDVPKDFPLGLGEPLEKRRMPRMLVGV